MRKSASRLSLLGACYLSSACAVGPNHEAPEIPAPKAHRSDDKATKETLADLPWWEVYHDRELFLLLREATSKAYDLRIAAARLEIARQQHRAAAWALAPTVGINGGIGDGHGSTMIPGPTPFDYGSNFGLGASASWEPDVWGRLRRLKESALEDYYATEEARRGIYISLVGDVAELYFQLGGLDAQAVHAQAAIESRRQTVKFFESRSAGGVGGNLEVERARANLSAAEAAITDIELGIASTENTLSFLVARPPGPIARTPLEKIALAEQVPSGLPSSLLQRRPDILTADHQLRAANARIGAEMADFFPNFTLTGALGVVSPDLKSAEGVYSGAGLFNWTLPFLGGERVRAEYDAAKAAWEGATANYERTCFNAFREVATALANIQALQRRTVSLLGQKKALEAAEKTALERYQGGVANYLDVLTVQEQVLIAQLSYDSALAGRKIAVARLYRVLGGGWPKPPEEEEPKEEKPADGSVAN